MQVKMHKTQYEVAVDPHRFRVLCAGRRWGKSVLSRMVVLKWALEKPGIYWIVSPNYKQSKMIHWRDLQREVPRELISKKNEVELSFTLVNGSIIELKGAENPDALRGVKLNGLVIDEIASIRNWDWLWSEVLRPTLTDFQAPALFISTPKGFNHFHELYLTGQNSSLDYKSWKYTSYDNPYIPKGELDAAKSELTEDTFAQEYLADFRKHTGLVYKEFDRAIHVIDPFTVPDSWTMYRGVDFGSTNPTACLWIAVDGDENWSIVGEHYDTGQTIDYHAGRINASTLSRRVVQTFGDPSGAQWINEFSTRGIYITPATKEIGQAFNTWVTFGIDKVAQQLKLVPGRQVPAVSIQKTLHGQPRMYIFNTCTNLVREFETYRWKEKSVTQSQDLNEPEVVEKANDHALDALRYFAVSYQKPTPKYTPPPSDISLKDWRI